MHVENGRCARFRPDPCLAKPARHGAPGNEGFGLLKGTFPEIKITAGSPYGTPYFRTAQGWATRGLLLHAKRELADSWPIRAEVRTMSLGVQNRFSRSDPATYQWVICGVDRN